MFTGRTQPEKEADLILKIKCSGYIGLGIPEHTPGFLAIPKNCVIAKGRTALDLIR
jgi:hypothetical protein